MNLPKKIKFGHRTITVEYSEKLWYEQQLMADVTNINSHKIIIDTTMCDDVQQRCLFLNTLFIAYGTAFLCHESVDDIETLILALFACCRDNPILLSPMNVKDIKSLRILASTYTVSDDFEGDDNAEINYLYQRIRYQAQLPDSRVHQSLIHEFIHAVVKHLSLKKPSEGDVHRMAWLTSLLFTQNDFSWLLETDNAKDNN